MSLRRPSATDRRQQLKSSTHDFLFFLDQLFTNSNSFGSYTETFTISTQLWLGDEHMKLSKYTDFQIKMALHRRVDDSVSAQGSQEHNLMTGSQETERMRKLVHASQNKKIVGSPKSNQPKQKLFYIRPSLHLVAPPAEHGPFTTRSSWGQMSFHRETSDVQVCSAPMWGCHAGGCSVTAASAARTATTPTVHCSRRLHIVQCAEVKTYPYHI